MSRLACRCTWSGRPASRTKHGFSARRPGRYFSHRAESTRRQLRQLFRVGRTSLVIGIVCLTASIALGDLLARMLRESHLGEVLRESLLIGGWVAMWRPLEIFLYDWWPIRDEARLFDRLARMVVRIVYTSDVGQEKWRADWPAVSPGPGSLTHVPLAYVPENARHDAGAGTEPTTPIDRVARLTSPTKAR